VADFREDCRGRAANQELQTIPTGVQLEALDPIGEVEDN
jgi:hypothetical protein